MPALTNDDKVQAFRRACTSMARADDRWADRAETGLSDDDLEAALRFEFGSYWSCCGPASISICAQGNGLRIWASWDTVGPEVDTKPIYQGTASIRMARDMWGIPDPDNMQISLF